MYAVSRSVLSLGLALGFALLLVAACAPASGASRGTAVPTILPRTAVGAAATSGASAPAATSPAGAAASPASSSAPGKQWPSPPDLSIDPNSQYFATITTTAGEVTVELFAREVPRTVNNFVFLAREDFYDNVKFHRIMKDFMVQTGDPTGTGTGGPGYRFADEPVSRDYEAGIIAMANSGPNTNGSQFFIMHGNRPLPKNYTIFGRVTSGMDVVDRIANTPVRPSPQGEASVPTQDVRIVDVRIEERAA